MFPALKKLTVTLTTVFVMSLILLGCTSSHPDDHKISVETTATNNSQGLSVVVHNPNGVDIFVPASWNGIAVYRQEDEDNWVEYRQANPWQAMFGTDQYEVEYYIPQNTLEPGVYKLIIHVRLGEDGNSMELETKFEISKRFLDANLERVVSK